MERKVCCFCSESIAAEPQAEIAVQLQDGGVQAFWCHQACLGERLHPSIPTSIPIPEHKSATLTEHDAYLAMFAFLESHYAVSGSNDIGALLGGLSLLPDGTPADAAFRQEWSSAVKSALDGAVRANLTLVRR